MPHRPYPSILQWNMRVPKIWLLAWGWILHHIGRFPLPIRRSAQLLLCSRGSTLTANQTWLRLCAPRSNVLASLSSWELRRAAFAPVGTAFEHLSGFRYQNIRVAAWLFVRTKTWWLAWNKSKALSRKAKPIAFLFKATKTSITTK
jgi:hypothetical protein